MFNLRNIDLNLLTVFEAIYELGSVSAAADRLALSQSATSHALARLRDACKDALFVRAPQGLSPTPVAKAIYPAIKQALDALRASLAEASGFVPAQSQRHFRISIPHPLGPFYGLDLKAAAEAVAPRTVLIFDTVTRPVDLEDSIRDGIVDIAIDWLPVELDPFINQKLFDDRLVLLARNDHPSVRDGVTVDDLRKEKLVAGHRRRDIEHLPQAIREFYKLELLEAVRVSELLEIPTVVASTNLLGMFVASMGPLMEKRLGLRVLPIPVELPAVPIYMIWHESRRNDARIAGCESWWQRSWAVARQPTLEPAFEVGDARTLRMRDFIELSPTSPIRPGFRQSRRSKFLFWKGSERAQRTETAVVPTYPIPDRPAGAVCAAGHVLAPQDSQEGR